ncbi:hypothetical protein M408DRAFT_18787 [Serendipita vermifera MAFF 305830]|uniref:Oxidoreductase-like domain-containing protein n=1 Tax=Serendipita vermifera MAFF 305830 TaxID=933852 RepID=A0A0C2XY35_SERVB|nr:hypothetical protein M408DRAFT_18787 [Serendipita vermifera MAFF 305830]
MDLRFLLCEHGHASSRRQLHTRKLRPSRNYQVRHAHNLSDRFRILESKLRPRGQEPQIEKSTPVEETLDISQAPNKASTSTPVEVEMETLNLGGSKSILRPKPRTFKGVSIPIKPPPPASDECCMSSCTVCVYDLYATALEEYDEGLAHARSELSARSIPVDEWPSDVLTTEARKEREQARKLEGGLDAGRRMGVTGESDRDKQMAVIIGAFVKFEQALKERRKAERAANPTTGQESLSRSESRP